MKSNIRKVNDALALLFQFASDDSAEQLEAIALREGWLWRCACGWNNESAEKKCGQCKQAPE